MKKILLAAILFSSRLPLGATEAFPADVQKHIDRREGCDHMRGELPDPGDKRRMREVEREIRKLCKGTDAGLQQLKKKYAANPAVIGRLGEFEPDVEALTAAAAATGRRR